MCGICGFIAGNKRGTADWKQMLNRMTRVLIHRGPDGEGHYCTNTGNSIVGLGHRRLSIIDLSEKASQPMANEDGSVVVVFNGEIYNYEVLTVQLKKKGHIFKSHSDTETIVHLYEELGDQCVNNLDGMFAFALWDKKSARLLLARDRMGIKPLFYVLKEGNLYFASEIKSLLLLDEVSRQIDFRALDYYFTYGYIPGFRTIFKDIKKLPPASYLSFKNRQMKINPFWSIRYLQKNNIPENELMDRLVDTFSKAVKRHMVSDVPLGAFLSGGLDSSIVVALMNRVGGETIDTFSLGYESGGKDELDYAALVAGYYGTNHHEFRVAPEMTQILPELLWHLDEPFFDNSIIPTYYISKLAKKSIKVVLSGDGGDEIFGGYEWTRRQQYHTAYKAFPGFIRKTLGKLGSGTGPENDYGTDVMTRARRFFGDLNKGVEEGFLRRTSVSYAFRRMLYSRRFKEELGDFDGSGYQSMLFSKAEVRDNREKMLYVDTMSFLPDDCLFKVDRMSMAHGLEVRVPFLDRELVEFMARIPFEYKIRGLTSKYILKKAFSRYLPKKILKQRKQGFTIPISAWLRGGLGNLANRILLSDSLEKRDLFGKDVLRWMLKEHRKGTQEFGHRIWSIVVFETWARLFLDMKIDDKPDMTLTNIASSS
jgi:asparagine synthase (glutamine-hydrolysing)